MIPFWKMICFLAIMVAGSALQQSSQNSRTEPGLAANNFVMLSPECDDEPIVVRGHVRTVGGSPISGASVKLKQGGVVKYQTTTDGSGAYCMGGVTSGNYVIHLSASGYVTKTADITVSSEVVRADSLIAQ